MPTPRDFRLPDVGEGLTEAEILTWSVHPGDHVEVNQILVEVETAKAAVELPSPYEGTVTALHAQAGATVLVGAPIITIDTASTTAPPDQPGNEASAEPAGPAAVEPVVELLVGYGPRAGRSARRRTKAAVMTTVPRLPNGTLDTAPRVAAKPPVRKLAKELGVDLSTVLSTGPEGTVTRDDVRRAVAGGDQAATMSQPAVNGQLRETRIPIRGVRKHTAAAMVASAFTAPHVTEFVTLDITETMRLRDRIAARREFSDLRVSPLLLVAKALLLAIRRTPEANASWDEQAQEIVIKHYVNLGIAAATDRGLVVPNIRDADRMSLHELATALANLTTTARAGRTTPGDMSEGTITITNVGVFGIDTGTPILNPGEAAILAFGTVHRAPWVVTDADGHERIDPRWVTQLALSFDHRVIDGQQGSRLLADVAAVLSDPGLAMM